MKLLLKLAVVALLFCLLAVGGLLFGLDSALRTAVEKGGTHALGVPTHLSKASLGILSGELTLGGLEIENPPGFEATPFLTLEHAHTSVDLASLRADVVRIDLVELESVHLLLQRREGRSNYRVILDHLAAGEQAGEDTPEDAPTGDDEGPKVNIARLVIRDVRADFDLLPVGGQLTRASVTLPELVLEDLGNSDEGASVADVTARVVEALLQATLQAGGEVLSPELLNDLRDGLAGLGVQALDLGEGVLGEVSGALEKAGGQAGKALEGLGGSLDGLLPGKKKKQE